MDNSPTAQIAPAIVNRTNGLRAAEVCDLRWEQIDFAAATLHVRRKRMARQPHIR